MDIVTKVTGIIEPSLEAMGYSIVQVKMADGARRKTLSIMAERKDGHHMSFDDCSEISRTAGALLEVEDPIIGAYDLEVCSPGLDRPLTRREDFEIYKGQEAKVETMIPQEAGRKRFRGVLGGLKDHYVLLAMPEGDVKIAFENIRAARLIPKVATGDGKKEQKKRNAKV